MKKWKKLRKGLAVFLAGATLLSPMSVAAENIFTGGSGIEGTMDSTEPGADDGSGRSADEQNPAVTPGGSKESQPGTDSEGEEGKIPGGQESPESDPPKTEDDPTLNSQEPELEGQQDDPDLQENVTPQEGLVPSDGSLAGESIKFVNLYWETDDLGDLEAVFDGGMDEDLVQTLTKSDRGVYETVIPAGDYSRISFRRAGSDTPIIRGVYNYYGVDMADASTETVAFIPQVNNTYYYDMGENPSYWGADPDYEVTDPEVPVTVLKEEPQVQPVSLAEDNVQSEDVTPGDPATDGNTPGEPGAEGGESGNPVPEPPEPEIVPVTAPKTEQENPESGNPKPGQMIYAIDLDQRENYLVRQPTTTYRVNIGFLVEGHNDINSWETDIIATGQGEMYTMYEREPGLYTAPFPARAEKTTDNDVTNLSQKYYSEIAFSLQDKDGTPSEQNRNSRHFNFRGHEPTTEELAKFGHFSYYSGYTDTYYMNSNQDDSYWGAHPSRADQSLDTQVLYVNVEDYTKNHIIADLDDMWMSWNGMPQGAEGDENFDPVKGWKITKTLPHENIRYFQFPKNSGATENTILTIHFKLKALEGTLTDGQKDMEYTYKFTLVPRSERNRLNMDYIWEFNGQIWDHFQAGGELETRSIFFENLRTQYEGVWMRVAKEDGSYADKEDIELWNLPSEEEKNEWVTSHVEEITDTAGKVTSTWLKMDKVASPQEYDKEDLFRLDIPGDYTKIQFRGILKEGDQEKIYYSNASTITEESAYPCYYAYQTGSSSDVVPESDMKTPGITGYWTSVYSVNTVGDESIDIPTGNIEWEEGVYYADSTFYDYYSDWEMTGRKITEWNEKNNDIWKVQAKNINAALDGYYQAAVENPDQSGLRAFYMSGDGFQTNNMLTGEALWNRDVKQQNEWTKKDGGPRYDIVADHLSSEGNLLLNEEIGDAMQATDVELPLFKEDFLRGNNNLDTAVGNVYKNVKFPIHADMDPDSKTYGYWVYNSARESDAFRLTYDVDEGYFLRRTGEGIPFKGKYAFFPFNDQADFSPDLMGSSVMNIENERSRANYMFGSRMEFPFAMTEDGYVYRDKNKNGMIDAETEKDPITFEFQGDDDVWIFIDGIMAVDLGGIHDAVRGTIDLTNGTWEVKRALKSGSTFDGKGEDAGHGNLSQELKNLLNDKSKSHTLTMFYMERGLWESNMKLTFNFPRTNRFIVEKEVDVESTRVGGEDIFAGLLENMGSFNFNIKNQATSGESLPVEESAGYRKPGANIPLFNAVAQNKVNADFSFNAEKDTVTKDSSSGIVTVKQQSQVSGETPSEETLLKISPTNGVALNVADKDYLRLSMKNHGATDRNASNLYLSFVDSQKKRVGGYAGSLDYNGESNTFLTNEDSILRINFKEMRGDPDFDWGSVAYMLIGIRRNNPEDIAAYEISYISFYEKLEEKLHSGFYVDDTQISDYGSVNAQTLMPVDGAWYVKQSKNASGSYDSGVAWNTEGGTFNLADGQRAVFTDRFRTGSYIALKENREPKIFDTQWTLREGGQEIPARYLLSSRHDITTVKNPLNTIATEFPLSNVNGDVVGDGREEIVDSTWRERFAKPKESTLVYRSYQDPDSSANIGTDLSVTVKNTLKRGSITIKKKLTEESRDPGTGKYKPAEFTFRIYYTNIAGRGLEKQLDPIDEERRYLLQTVTVQTDEKGEGEITVPNIPAGTRYYIVEVPSNGTRLEKIEIGEPAPDEPHEKVDIHEVTGADPEKDYSKAYVAGTAYASDQAVTFTNQIVPFYMDIEKIWKDGLTDKERNIEKVHIQLQRRIQGSEAEWEVVTKDYFENAITDTEKGDYIKLNEENKWKTTSKIPLPVECDEEGEDKGKLYEYRIVELNNDNIFQKYTVSYDYVRNEDYVDKEGNEFLHVTYQAINTPAQLHLKKIWKGTQEGVAPPRIRVKLLASASYTPPSADSQETSEAENSQGSGEWVCYRKLTNTHHECSNSCYIELSAAGDWSASMRNLPMQKSEGKPYYYKLGEEQILLDGGWLDVADTSSGCEAAYGSPVTITQTGGEIATVTVENTMTLGSITILKQGEDQEPLQDASFKIEHLIKEESESENGKWIADPNWKVRNSVTDTAGKIVFSQLPEGTYRITETKAPGGYILDPKGIIVTIPGGTLAETYKNVTVEADGKNDTHITLKIKNSKLYELPSAGGPGIYRYMITGILLMLAAVFILYKRRDEEVLRR